MRVVFLHGSTDGPRNYSRVVAELRGGGVASVAPPLPSDRPQWHAEEYAAYVASTVDARSPVVVASSAAGLLLPAVAQALDAVHMVWVAAYVPEPGTNLAQEISDHAAEIFNTEWIEAGDPTEDPVAGAYFLFHDCDFATLRWALDGTHLFLPETAYAATFPAGGMPDLPSTYVVASLDRTIRPAWQREVAVDRLSAHVVELESGHCPHVSRPYELAAIIHQLVHQ